MAETVQLAEEVIAAVAKRLGGSAELIFGGRDPVVDLREVFEIWYLPGPVLDPEADVAAEARFDERYHHQIFVDGRPAGFAVSKPGARAEDWSVARVAASPFAADVDKAIGIVDEMVPEPLRVRMLKVPASLLTAFWIVDPQHDRFYIVSCPASLISIRQGAVFDRAGFARALFAEQREGSATQSPRQAKE